MRKKLICLLTVALLLPSQAMAVYETDGMNFIESDGGIKFFGGYNKYIFDGSKELVEAGANFQQIELGPRSTIVSEEFEIPSWTTQTTETRTAEIDSNTSRNGMNSLKLSGNSSYDGTYSEMSQTMTAKSNKLYRIEFDVKGVNARGNVVMANNIKKFLPTGTYDWQRVGLTVKNDSSLNLKFRSYNTTDGLWIDNITVTELDGQYSIINNGDFEQVFSENGFLVNEGVTNYVKSVMAENEQIGMSSTVLLSPHYIPDWFWTNYPEAYYYQEGFLKGDLLDEDYIEFIKTHVRAMTEAVAGFDSLHSIVLTNEPIYNTSYYSGGQSYRDDFIVFLKEKYGKSSYGDAYVPSKLISNWGKSEGIFLTWDTLQNRSYLMPSSNDIVSDGRFWDFMEFNNKIFGDFHKLLADTVHNVDETIPVHTKLYYNAFSRDALDYGTDFEDLNAYFDYNGFDGGMTYSSSRKGYLQIRMMEDLANSVSNTPTVNSENHIISDNSEYVDKYALIAGADLWQGIIHGRTASSAWSWNYEGCRISKMPDVQKALADNLKNANRLADKVVKTKKSVRLEPMNPYERKVIHATLQSNPSVNTRSEGEEPYRRVVIELAK